MKIFSLPSDFSNSAILFDMDETLYFHKEYAQTQIDLPIKKLAMLKGKTFDDMKVQIDEYRKNWASSNEGGFISLGNTFTAFGVSIKENVIWREELCRPENYLCVDSRLRNTLEILSQNFKLAVVTNNPVSVAIRTLKVLGVHDILKIIIGLDTFYISKPDKIIFNRACELCGVSIHNCISVGDRYDIDIALPLEMGMGGILVDGVEDVYKLPDVIVSCNT